jgi:serine/threonine protein kinase
MELFEGGSVHKVMKLLGRSITSLLIFEGEPLAEVQIVSILGQVLKGIQALHQAKTIHRDIKAIIIPHFLIF